MRFALLIALLLPGQDTPAQEATALIKKLGDDDVGVRQKAQLRLLELGPEVRDTLERERATAEPEARLRLGEILRAFEWANAFPTLTWKDLRAAVAGAAPSTDEEWERAEGLLRGPLLDGRARAEPARLCFERLLEAGPERWALFAIRALGLLGDARSVPGLLKAMGQGPPFREPACRALRLSADDSSVPALLAAMRSSDVPDELHSILVRAATPASGKAVADAFRTLDAGHPGRRLLGNLLGRIGGEEAFDAMSGHPPEEAYDLWTNAWLAVLLRHAAAHPGDERVRKLLRGHLETTEDPVIDVGLRAALALAEPASVGEVVGHIGRDRRHTLAGVEELLLRYGRGNAAPVARRFLADEDIYLRGLSVKLLAALDEEADGARVAGALAADRTDPDAAALAVAVAGNAGLLKEIFRRPPSPDVLFAALSTRPSREWEPKLLAFLEKEELWHAPLAVDFLASWGGPASGEWLARERASEPADYFDHIRVAVRLSPKSAPALRRHLDSPEHEGVLAAMAALCGAGDEKAVEKLTAGLKDADLRSDCLRIAAETGAGSPALQKELERLVIEGEDARERGLALKALARRTDPQTAMALAAKGPSTWDETMAELGDRGAIERVLASEDPDSWAAAAGRVEPERIARRIRWALTGEEPAGLQELMRSHPKTCPPGLAARELRRMLHEDLEMVEQPPERVAWIEAGSASGAVTELAALARHSGFAYIRFRAVRALGASADPAAIPILLEFLDDVTVGSTVEFDASTYHYFVIADEAARGLEKLAGRRFPGTRPVRAAAWREWHAKSGSRR